MTKPYNPNDVTMLCGTDVVTAFTSEPYAVEQKAAIEIKPQASSGTRRFRLYSPDSRITVDIEVYSDSPSIAHIEPLLTTSVSEAGKVTISIEGNKPEPITNKLMRFFKG